MRSSATDLFNFSLFLLISVVFYILFEDVFLLFVLLASLTASCSVLLLTLYPIIQSSKIDFQPDFSVRGGIEFREHPGSDFRAIDMIVKEIILIPRGYNLRKKNFLRAKIFHEIAHLDRGDAKFFCFVYPSLFAALIVMIGIVVGSPAPDFFGIPSFIERQGGGIEEREARTVVMFFVLVLPATIISSIFFTVRDREYGADRLSYKRLGLDYQAMLSHMAVSERYREAKNIYIRLLNKLTHPASGARLDALGNDRSEGPYLGLASGALYTVGLLTTVFGGGLSASVVLIEIKVGVIDFSTLGFADLFDYRRAIGVVAIVLLFFLILHVYMAILFYNTIKKSELFFFARKSFAHVFASSAVVTLVLNGVVLFFPWLLQDATKVFVFPTFLTVFVTLQAMLSWFFWRAALRIYPKRIHSILVHMFCGVLIVMAAFRAQQWVLRLTGYGSFSNIW